MRKEDGDRVEMEAGSKRHAGTCIKIGSQGAPPSRFLLFFLISELMTYWRLPTIQSIYDDSEAAKRLSAPTSPRSGLSCVQGEFFRLPLLSD